MITFRPMQFEDCEFLSSIRNECAEKYLHNSTLYSLKETQQWFYTLKVPYYIVYNDNTKIGYFRLANYSSVNHNIFLGMDIKQEFRGKGLAFESYRKFIPYLIDQFSLHKISLEVLATNIRAYNLYIKLGFVKEGLKRQDALKNGEYIDSIIMSILKNEVKTYPRCFSV